MLTIEHPRFVEFFAKTISVGILLHNIKNILLRAEYIFRGHLNKLGVVDGDSLDCMGCKKNQPRLTENRL